jgi:hypothetical protein
MQTLECPRYMQCRTEKESVKVVNGKPYSMLNVKHETKGMRAGYMCAQEKM